jgi:uncharacterized protein YndB with AHSA1/START domain
MGTYTVLLHRVLAAKPERVYRALIDADALVKWMAPHGFTAKVHHLDARPGGGYRMSFTNFSTGSTHSFGGIYDELVPGKLLRYRDEFEDPNLPGEMRMTVELEEVSVGTDLRITQEGVPDIIPAEACYIGWQQSLQLLALLVEPEIPD